MTQVQISNVYPKTDSSPMIVHFQNGYTSEDFGSKDCVFLMNENNSKKCLAADIGDTMYTGEEIEEDLGKTLILARNKKTGKVRLIEVGTVEMKPNIISDLNSTQVLDTSALELSKKFGSKRHKKIVEQREKLKINSDIVLEQVQNVSQNISMDQLDLSSYNKNDSEEFYIPKINREATKVEEVYDIDDILTTTQYDTMFNEIEQSEYPNNLLPYLKLFYRKDMSNKHKVLLVYADALLQLFSKNTKDMTKKLVICPFSATLNEHILQNFFSYVNGKRCRPLQYKDKALCFALVLLLLINNYKLDVDELSVQLKLSARRTAMKVYITGANIVTLGGKKMAQLKLPLKKTNDRRKSAKF